VPDVLLKDINIDDYDALILPGGITGTPNMLASKLVIDVVKRHYNNGKLTAAICMGPLVFMASEIGFGKNITSYPKSMDALKEKYNFVIQDVVQDGNLITSRGPGTVWQFTLKIAENLVGTEQTKLRAEINLLDDSFDKIKSLYP
jgi:putative intracellular protease/amidase